MLRTALSLTLFDSLPLYVARMILAARAERFEVVDHVARAGNTGLKRLLCRYCSGRNVGTGRLSLRT